jgi:4,5-DOPA dioxygenase extradiol
MLQPAMFIGHGNPMNAVAENDYTAGWRSLGQQIPRPRAIVSVSAHWFISGTYVTVDKIPKTIHDFGGFPPQLYKIQYPAPGDPELSRHLQSLLSPVPVMLSESWGLDHGTWSVLRHVYPEADIPIVQLSIDRRQPASFHFELGRRLTNLRTEGVLIMGSGNLVHNLQHYAWDQSASNPYDWAVRFEKKARALLAAGDFQSLVQYEELGLDATLSVPTPDHYLPLLYVIAARQADEPITYPVEGFDGGSMSMLTAQIG